MFLVRESMVLVRESMVLVRENMFLVRETYFSYIFRYSIFFKYSSKNTSISFSINAFGTECFAFWHRMYFKNRVDADALNQSPFLSLWFQFSIPHVLVSSPFVVCSAVRMADEDNRSEMNGGPESLLGGADAVKIVFHLSKVCLCCSKEHRCQSAEHCFILGPVVRQSPLGKDKDGLWPGVWQVC